MSNQPPLNPDALEAGAKAMYNEEPWQKSTYSVESHSWEEIQEEDRQAFREEAEVAVSAYLAAALPEVTEREQLTALPEKIVLEDRRGTIWQKINGTWYTPGSKHDYSDQSVMLPARVLYRPEVKP